MQSCRMLCLSERLRTAILDELLFDRANYNVVGPFTMFASERRIACVAVMALRQFYLEKITNLSIGRVVQPKVSSEFRELIECRSDQPVVLETQAIDRELEFAALPFKESVLLF